MVMRIVLVKHALPISGDACGPSFVVLDAPDMALLEVVAELA
jgi:hypothetical protein